ncbi:MBL fold metallo-hydrolase [Paracoccus sp. (in: a-proteobacteria)]|uniref:MBL fold metallo-hydrolase n=1 Tax=Paracoccus sp. TaxID=267 RepID=UPI0026DED308|nr:MBL fold metallo-hydrolase [Paracoccus sp. (in: a-proteobacteria)]MDO5370816.1 MBL fold metallo-hydrolase [Paracoccus sp. (in: a-proteobacteria)]
MTAAPRPADGIRHPWPEPPAEGEATEVAPGVFWMRLPLPMRLDHVNAYALADADGWTIVDTGFDTKRARTIWQTLLAGPLAGAPVARVLATHQHPDHIGLAGWFMDQGAELLTSRTAWLFARMLALDVQDSPVPQQVEFWRRAGMDEARLDQRMRERPWNTADVVHPLPLGYRRLRDGQRLRLGGRDWTVLTGEGHAAEHLTLWSDSDDLVIGGDQLLPGISPNLGVYATEPGADPVGDWLDSCARFAGLAEPRHLVLPGHKLPFTGLPQRLQQLAENHESALRRLAAALAQGPRTAAGCFDLLFGRRIGDSEYGLALAEAVAHLNALHKRGLAEPVGTDALGGVLWRA